MIIDNVFFYGISSDSNPLVQPFNTFWFSLLAFGKTLLPSQPTNTSDIVDVQLYNNEINSRIINNHKHYVRRKVTSWKTRDDSNYALLELCEDSFLNVKKRCLIWNLGVGHFFSRLPNLEDFFRDPIFFRNT